MNASGVHSIVTVVTQIKEGRLEPLREALRVIGDPDRPSPIEAIGTIIY